MKIIKSNVELLPSQELGIDGMFKRIELTGRISYKSEENITESSYKKFVNMIYKKGHHSVFEQGTVYLSIPITDEKDFISKLDDREIKPYVRIFKNLGLYHITTNYRIICKLKAEEIMETYWVVPGEYHSRRITTKWICSRSIAQEVLRHRVFSPVKESTRYVNYSKDKFGGEITFIFPQWAYKVRDYVSQFPDAAGNYPYFDPNQSEQELWNQLVTLDRTVASRNSRYKEEEAEYLWEISTEESYRLTPEDARDTLNMGLKCEFYLTGFADDWNYKVLDPENNPEKAGFFELRCAKDAHPDVRVLAIELRELFKSSGLDKLK